MDTSAVLVTLSNRRDIDSAKQLFGAAATRGRWKGDYCLICNGLLESEKEWFITRGVIVKEYETVIDPAIWRSKRPVNPGSQIFLLKFYLFGQDFKSWDTVVYLDTDILINGPIDRLSRIKKFSAVPDPLRRIKDMLYRDADLTSVGSRELLNSKAFNTGVFAFSPALYPDDAVDNLVNLTLEHTTKGFFSDQHIINVYFEGSWDRLPFGFNSMFQLYDQYLSPWMLPSLDNSRVAHFAGPRKPSNPNSPYHHRWKRNLEIAESIGDFNTVQIGYKKVKVAPEGKLRFFYELLHLRKHNRVGNFLYRTGLVRGIFMLLRFALRHVSGRLVRSVDGPFLVKLLIPQLVRAVPGKVKIDASTCCQLSCIGCPQSSGHIEKTLGRGFLGLSELTTFIEKNRWIHTVELSNWGEPFLNPELKAILDTGWKKKVQFSLSNGVNINFLPDAVAEALVMSRVKQITCSLDGASQESYSMYRRGGNLKKALANIEKIVSYKKKYNSKLPHLVWQFIIFDHNEHEIGDAEKRAADLGMTFAPKIPWEDLYGTEALKNCRPDIALKKTGYRNRYDWYNENPEDYIDRFCLSMWKQPQINFDGRVLGCVVNYWGDYGNSFTDPLLRILNGRKMRYARAMLLGFKPPKEDIPCSRCPLFSKRIEDGHFIRPEKILRR